MIDRKRTWPLALAVTSLLAGCGGPVDRATDRKTLEAFLADPAKGDSAAAIKAAERLSGQSPSTIEPGEKLLLAGFYDQRGNSDAALSMLALITDDDSAVAQAARLSEARLSIARSHQARRAEKCLETAIRLDPRSTIAWSNQADLFDIQNRIGERDSAFAKLEELSALDRERLLKWTCDRRTDADENERLTILKLFIDADAEDEVSGIALADELTRRGEFDQATSVLDRFRVASEPENADRIIVRRAMIAAQKGEFADSSGLLQSLTAEPKRPADALLYFRLFGRIRLHFRQYPAAESALRKALAIAPLDRESHQLLAQTLRLAGRSAEAEPIEARLKRIDRLEDLAQKVRATIRRDDPKTLREIADSATALGRYDIARAWLREILAKDPLNAGIQQEIFRVDQLSKTSRARKGVRSLFAR